MDAQSPLPLLSIFLFLLKPEYPTAQIRELGSQFSGRKIPLGITFAKGDPAVGQIFHFWILELLIVNISVCKLKKKIVLTKLVLSSFF